LTALVSPAGIEPTSPV